MKYKVTIYPKDGEKKEFIYGAENNVETIRRFVMTLDSEIGLYIDKIEKFEWKEEK